MMFDLDDVIVIGSVELPDKMTLGELKEIHDDWYPYIQDPDEDYFDLLEGSFQLGTKVCYLQELIIRISKYGGIIDDAYINDIKCKNQDSIGKDFMALAKASSEEYSTKLNEFLFEHFPWELEEDGFEEEEE